MLVRFTPKQIRIMQLLTEGLTNKEIAAQVGNTEHVLKNYLRTIYDLSGMSNRTELALWYLHHYERGTNEPSTAPSKD